MPSSDPGHGSRSKLGCATEDLQGSWLKHSAHNLICYPGLMWILASLNLAVGSVSSWLFSDRWGRQCPVVRDVNVRTGDSVQDPGTAQALERL